MSTFLGEQEKHALSLPALSDRRESNVTKGRPPDAWGCWVEFRNSPRGPMLGIIQIRRKATKEMHLPILRRPEVIEKHHKDVYTDLG